MYVTSYVAHPHPHTHTNICTPAGQISRESLFRQ